MVGGDVATTAAAAGSGAVDDATTAKMRQSQSWVPESHAPLGVSIFVLDAKFF